MDPKWKLLAAAGLALSVLPLAPAAAADTDDKVEHGAKSVGKTVTHGASGVGKGGSRIYPNAATRVHKLAAKNRKNKQAKAKHLQKADQHYKHADRKEKQSQKEMNHAGSAAGQVGK